MRTIPWCIMLLSLFLLLLPCINSQASQWYDTFQKTLCHDRWAQMDWQSILRPCRFNMEFGRNKYDKRDRTSPKWSHTLGLHFKKTGEFSKVGIQSRTGDGHNKNIGGDTWRVFIRGADRITPFVSDLNNGVYEAKFIAINPGFYKAEIVLQSTLCEAFKDPPQDWLKRDANTIITDEKDATLMWAPLRGGNISFKIEDSSDEVKQGLRRSFTRWKDSCGQQYGCNLLWKGFGRWTNSTWIPYINDDGPPSDVEGRCLKQNEGVLKITGDKLSHEIYKAVNKTDLCNGGIFTRCIGESPGEQPDRKAFSKRTKKTKPLSTKTYLNALKGLLSKEEMDENSGLLLNYGDTFVQNMGFKKYRLFIDRAVKILKEKYKGKAVWRTIASNWKDSLDPNFHFLNHQRIQLFNAYATSAMCNAGIPVLDVYQMSESAPTADKKAVINTVENILKDYFRKNPSKTCETADIEAKNNTAVSTAETEPPQGTMVDGSVPANHLASVPSPVAPASSPVGVSSYISTPNAIVVDNSYMGTPNVDYANIRTSKMSQMKFDAEFDLQLRKKRSLSAE